MGIVLVICILLLSVSVEQSLGCIGRNSFPDGFLFGTATSAYQCEGAAYEDGRGPSIWDTYTQNYPDRIRDHQNGNIAVDSYHRYKEDVAIMKSLGFDAYRFSFSWSRLLPGGHLSGGVNKEGISYYNNLINELLLNEIQPFVTLFHWDFPQALEDEYGGFLSSNVVDDFRDYADLCFKTFGDRVKHWITLNEPLTVAKDGYGKGTKAPGRCSKYVNPDCPAGDSGIEPYIVAHNQLLAHAAAIKVYRDKYQSSQRGQIGITLNSEWIVPMNNKSSRDTLAASRVLAFKYDWFMEPLKSGLYPVEMVTYLGERLPKFTREQSLMLKGSFDFIGVNYYTANYAADIPCKSANFSYFTDACALVTCWRNGTPIGPETGSDWLYVYPRGFLELLLYTKYKFNNPVIYITENGVSQLDNNDPMKMMDDDIRVNYFKEHLSVLREAIESGVNVKGYFGWSLVDNFEWDDGFEIRFGIVYVDYQDGLKRLLKKSAMWFKEFLGSSNQSCSTKEYGSCNFLTFKNRKSITWR